MIVLLAQYLLKYHQIHLLMYNLFLLHYSIKKLGKSFEKKKKKKPSIYSLYLPFYKQKTASYISSLQITTLPMLLFSPFLIFH